MRYYICNHKIWRYYKISTLKSEKIQQLSIGSQELTVQTVVSTGFVGFPENTQQSILSTKLSVHFLASSLSFTVLGEDLNGDT